MVPQSIQKDRKFESDSRVLVKFILASCASEFWRFMASELKWNKMSYMSCSASMYWRSELSCIGPTTMATASSIYSVSENGAVTYIKMCIQVRVSSSLSSLHLELLFRHLINCEFIAQITSPKRSASVVRPNDLRWMRSCFRIRWIRKWNEKFPIARTAR